jgi:hypothetical protein
MLPEVFSVLSWAKGDVAALKGADHVSSTGAKIVNRIYATQGADVRGFQRVTVLSLWRR